MSQRAAVLLTVQTSKQLSDTSDRVQAMDSRMDQALQRAEKIDSQLLEMKGNLTQLGSSLNLLGSLSGLYSTLIQSMVRRHCGARASRRRRHRSPATGCGLVRQRPHDLISCLLFPALPCPHPPTGARVAP